jgi:hypothetical protein
MVMLVSQAREIAQQWVRDEGRHIPGFWGAFFHGSTAWLPGDAALTATSDVDVMVALTDAAPRSKPGKFVHRGVLLEVSYLPRDQVRSPEQVLGQSHLAGSLRAPSVIADPSGELTSLQAAVARDFARRQWVRRRCEAVQSKIAGNLHSLREDTPLHENVSAWLFATGLTTHLLLVAGLRNPTVRRRYVAVRELLTDYGRAAFYPELLALLGCANLSRDRALRHLAALTEAFDAAAAMIETPFFFASDLSQAARPIAIDGSRVLIERGDHREAVFWLVATYARCQQVFDHDAPAATQERFRPGFAHLLADLGITSFADMRRRGAEVDALLPRLWAEAEAIIAANPDIEA